MILVLEIAVGVALGLILGSVAVLSQVARVPLPKWIRPQFSFRCQVDRVDLTAYQVKVGLEGLGK